MFGILFVTFRIYLIPFRERHAKSAEFLALPRNKYGRTSTGNGEELFGDGGSPSGGGCESFIWRFRRPRIVDSSLSTSPTQSSGKRDSKARNPPEIDKIDKY